MKALGLRTMEVQGFPR